MEWVRRNVKRWRNPRFHKVQKFSRQNLRWGQNSLLFVIQAARKLAFISQAVSRAILQGYEQIHKQHTPAMAQQEQPRLLQEQPPQYHGQHHDEALSQTFKQKEQQPPIDQHRRSEPPSALTESHLLLVVNGCVESVNIGGRRGGTVCRYTTVVGRDWKQIWGLAGGLSQEGHCGDCTLEVTLNFPFQAAFQGTSLYGWPRMAFCIYAHDWLGRQIVAGYAQTAIPLQPGR
ncbi:uncharacterized protein LOC34618659 [Cyclospora cayetanensis]|uniref:B9 domain-containing protein 1 n=1 Tax=Cyclospora cayetanensis TaxID=88456 RepID=A0A6P6RRE5_9EIME|nr:uncharacterized protein LOC34618659 [Cyclospora cayetanensis]